jgi:hypothetical protein
MFVVAYDYGLCGVIDVNISIIFGYRCASSYAYLEMFHRYFSVVLCESYFCVAKVSIFLILFNAIFSIMIIFTEYISICCGTFNRICTDNGCFGAEQPTESIYFVPANDRHLKMLTAYSNYGVALDGPSRRMILAANAPPEYGIKSSSIMFTSEHLPYSPRNRCHIREADSQANSRPGSTRNVSQHQTPRRERRSRKHEDSDSLANDEQIYEVGLILCG